VPGLHRDVRLHHFTKELSFLGYTARGHFVDAASFGVPQRRNRLIMLATPTANSAALPESLTDALPYRFDRSLQTAGQCLAKSEDAYHSTDPLHQPRRSAPELIARIRAIPIGGTRFDLPPEYQLACHQSVQGATASYSRIVAGEPAPTLTTRCTTPACGQFIHPTEHRAITLREASLLQTFPPAYRFVGTYGEIERQIGNAVPVRMACALGVIVKGILRKKANIRSHLL
jgi:DNA (cytosine-5)-methyltransferase 1